MKHLKVWLAVLVLGASANHACAQGTVSWDCSYPAIGLTSGTIDVKGTFTVDSGWKLGSNNVTVRVWQDGSEVTYTDFVITSPESLSWGTFTVSGLTSGATYNVTVEMTFVDTATGLMSMIVITDPKTQKAGPVPGCG